MGNCWTKFCNRDQENYAEVQNIDSKNVHLITSMEKWEAKLSESTKEGKIDVLSYITGPHGVAQLVEDLDFEGVLPSRFQVIANFSASWCRPCKSMTPTYCDLADKYTSLVFLAIDVDELAELSKSWDIQATPTFVFFKDGRQVDKLVGADKKDLQQKVAALDESVIKSQNS